MAYEDVYICTDNIHSKTKDANMLSIICDALDAAGFTSHNKGIGSNLHCTVVQSAPDDSIVVNVYGGACATTLKEMGSTYFKKWQGNKKIVVAFLSPPRN